jgi:hypothetical protein
MKTNTSKDHTGDHAVLRHIVSPTTQIGAPPPLAAFLLYSTEQLK